MIVDIEWNKPEMCADCWQEIYGACQMQSASGRATPKMIRQFHTPEENNCPLLKPLKVVEIAPIVRILHQAAKNAATDGHCAAVNAINDAIRTIRLNVVGAENIQYWDANQKEAPRE